MTALLTGEQVLATLPAQLRALVAAHVTDVVSDPIRDKRYVELSRSGGVVAEFLTWYQAGGAAEKTCDAYERALARMCMHRPDLALDEWDSGALLEFLVGYPARFGMAGGSMQTKVYAPLRKFWGWAVPWKRLAWNPMDLMPKPPRANPKVLDIFTPGERAKLLLACEQGLCPKRDKAAYLLFDGTGARKTDVRLLQWADVSLAERYVIFRHRKGDKEQVIQFGDTLQAALLDAFHSPYPLLNRPPVLTDYVLYRNGANGSSRLHHLPSWVDPVKPMSETATQNWWVKLTGRAGIEYRKLHMTRHTHGTELYEATGDAEAVRERLGHSDPKSTLIYIHNSRRRHNAAVDALELYRQQLAETDS